MATPESQFAEFRASGSAVALAAVFDALAPELLLVAAHVAPRGVEPEDVVQNTFLDAIAKAASWDASRRLLPWLIGILVRNAQALGRQATRRPDPARLPSRPAPATPLDASAASELAAQVSCALEGLPRHYRQVLTLHLVHGFSSAQIAHALACPVATVRTRLHRGLERLRALLPVGLAACVTGVFTGRGLAAAREAVLAKVGAVEVPATVVAVATFGGFLLMTKLLTGAGAVLIAAALWMFWPRASADLAAPAAGGESVALAASESAPADAKPAAVEHPPVARPEPGTRTATTGTLRAEFVWAEDSAPVGVLEVRVARVEADRELDARSVPTDRDGILGLSLLAPGRYRVGALEQPGGETDVVAGAQASLRVTLEPLMDLHGIVVDDSDAPVAGAEVRAGGQTDVRVLAVTRADGRFRWRGDGLVAVWAQREGWVPSTVAEALHDGRNDLRLTLGARGLEAAGSVLGPDDAPVPGALVLISNVLRSIDAGLPVEQSRGPIVLRTDARGAFSTKSLASGEQLALAVAEGFGPALRAITLPDDGGQLTLRLCRGVTVRGVVRRAGVPCEDALLMVMPRPVPKRVAPMYGLLWPRTTSDAEGRYELRHLLPGALRITARPRGVPAVQQELDLADGEEFEWNPVLTTGLTVRGTVMDALGRPLAGWHVYAANGHPVVVATRSDASGRFVLEGLGSGPCRVDAAPPSASAASTLPWAYAQVTAGADDVLLRVAVPAGSGGYLIGQLMDADGGVPADTTVTVYTGVIGDGRFWTQPGGPDGHFRLGPLPPAGYRLHAERVDRQGVSATVNLETGRALEAGATLDVGTLTFERGVTLTVRLRHGDGTLVRAARLTLERRGASGTFTPVADGEWQATSVLPGTYNLRVYGDAFAIVNREVEVRADQPARVEITVEAGTPVRFVLRVPPAGPIVQPAHISLVVFDAQQNLVLQTGIESDASPCVLTCGMAPGKYRAQAILMGPVRHAFASFTVPSEQREGLDVALDLMPPSETGR